MCTYADCSLSQGASSQEEVRVYSLAYSCHSRSAACPGECLLKLSGKTEQRCLIAIACDTLYSDRKTCAGLYQRQAHSRLPGGVEERGEWGNREDLVEPAKWIKRGIILVEISQQWRWGRH